MTRYIALGTALLSIGLCAAGPVTRAALPWTSPTDATAYKKSKVSLIQAIAVAQRRIGGHATHADFRVRNGKGSFDVEVLVKSALTDVAIDATTDKVTDSTASGTVDSLSDDQRKVIMAAVASKISLESAVAQGDEMGDWTVDGGIEERAGEPVYRVDMLKDGKLQSIVIDASSGKVLPSDGNPK